MNIKNLKTKKKLGFTLIELLIVIALLGILAVGLLAAIDPLEQFKKGQDTGQRNATQELYNAVIRYYSIHQEYPWGTGTTFGPTSLEAGTASSIISMIVDSGELKSNFLDNIRRPQDIYMWGQDDGTDIEHSVCFRPQAKSIKTDPNTKYNASAVTIAGCIGNTNTCYWCLR